MDFKAFNQKQHEATRYLCGPTAMSIAETGSLRRLQSFCDQVWEYQPEDGLNEGTLDSTMEAILTPLGYQLVHTDDMDVKRVLDPSTEIRNVLTEVVDKGGFTRGVVVVQEGHWKHSFGFHKGVVMDAYDWTQANNRAWYIYAK